MMALAAGLAPEALDSLDCWRALGETVPDLLLVVDLQGTIRHANRPTNSWAVNELVGTHVLDLAPVDLRSGMSEALTDLFLTGEVQAHDLKIQRTDGRIRWFTVHAGPLRQSSMIVGSVIIARDVTSHRELESHLHATQRLEALGHLAGGLAHDLNSMLSIIIISTSMLSEQVADEATRGELTAILDAARRGETFTGQLLRFVRHQGTELEQQDLNAVVEEFAGMFNRMLGSEVELRLKLASDIPSVRAGNGQLEQVLMNLLLNARDAISGWGRITVRTRKVDGPGAKGITLAVEDTGAGMDDATRRRAFEPLFTTKGPENGTGLGLSTVSAITKQLGGIVSMRSQVGVGTTVEVMLPPAEGWRDYMAD